MYKIELDGFQLQRVTIALNMARQYFVDPLMTNSIPFSLINTCLLLVSITMCLMTS